MNKPILYYTEEQMCGCQHVDAYHIGPHCCHNHSCNPIPCGTCCPPTQPTTNYHGKVSVVGRTVLTVKYLDVHGHYQTFDIADGETYEFTAISATKGICKFAAKVKDFESNKGLDKLLNAPHEITVDALILDASDAYESKLLRVYIANIVGIKPIRVFDGEMNYPNGDTSAVVTGECACGCKTVNTLVDPFETV